MIRRILSWRRNKKNKEKVLVKSCPSLQYHLIFLRGQAKNIIWIYIFMKLTYFIPYLLPYVRAQDDIKVLRFIDLLQL